MVEGRRLTGIRNDNLTRSQEGNMRVSSCLYGEDRMRKCKNNVNNQMNRKTERERDLSLKELPSLTKSKDVDVMDCLTIVRALLFSNFLLLASPYRIILDLIHEKY